MPGARREATRIPPQLNPQLWIPRAPVPSWQREARGSQELGAPGRRQQQPKDSAGGAGIAREGRTYPQGQGCCEPRTARQTALAEKHRPRLLSAFQLFQKSLDLPSVFAPIIPALGRLKQEDYHKFEASRGYIPSSRSI